MSYVCSCCGEIHEDLPDLAFDRPTSAHHIPVKERPKRVRLDDDVCIVDEEHYFIRGVIEIPIHDHPDTFGIGAWVSLKPENFQTYVEHFDSAEIGPFFGWLSNEIWFGGAPTLNLKTMAHFRGGGLRPSIELETTDNPLARAQRDGISLDGAWAFVHEHVDRSAR
jgi:hypothetical protein